MPTKVFTSADILIAVIAGVDGADVVAAATQITAFDGTAAWTQNTNTDVSGFGGTTPGLGVSILVIGSLIDDASVPPVITMTNVHVAYDYTLSAGASVPVPSPDSTIGDDALSFNTPPVIQTLVVPGSISGHASDDVDDIAVYYGGTSRADLFAKSVAWVAVNNWGNFSGAPIPFVAHTRSSGITNYTLTVTYTTPASVISINPTFGSVNGGQTVVITGTGFTGPYVVEFDGVAATAVTVTSATRMTAVTPAHASGVVDVEVIGVGTLTDAYTYIIPPSFVLDPWPTNTPIQQGGGKARGK
jgi:hypothetical protein